MNPGKRITQWAVSIGGMVALALFQQDAGGEVATYPAPPGEPLSTDFTVKADQADIPVYLAQVCALDAEARRKYVATSPTGVQPCDPANASFASFDLKEGTAKVTVVCPRIVQSAKLLPSSSGIVPTISGNQVTFAVSQPGQYVLEVNGDWIHSLQLFVNPAETDVPDPKDTSVLYYGPGVHEVNDVKVSSGQTVYIAPGAVLYGKVPAGSNSKEAAIFSLVGDNITLRGRGIIDGSLCPVWSRRIVRASGKNIKIEGVVLRDASTWTLPIWSSDRVKVQNVKIFGYRQNSDGIDVCNSRNVEVSDCFVRTFDDLVVIKTSLLGGSEAKNITVRHCVLWNELAHALSLGAELRVNIENVRFVDCDVIHDKGREWVLRIFNGDAARVKNVDFEDIRIEETQRFASLWIGKTLWSKQAERGHIDGVTFSNIHAASPNRPGPLVDLAGFDADHSIQGVRFNRTMVGDAPLNDIDVKQNEFVRGVEIHSAP